MRLPVHVVERLNRYLDKVEALVQELGREPSAEEVAAKMKTTEEEVLDLKQVVRTTCSLDSPINDRADTFLARRDRRSDVRLARRYGGRGDATGGNDGPG